MNTEWYFYGLLFSCFACVLFAYMRGTEGALAGTGEGKSIHSPVLMVLAAMPFFLLSALRWYVGTDYHNYTMDFPDVITGVNTYYEKGYSCFCKLIGLFTTDPKALIVVTSAVFVFGTFYVLFKRSENILLSLYIFFCSFVFFISMNNIRQSLAQVFALIGLYLLVDGKKIGFVIFTLLAASMHQIALVYFGLGVLFFFDVNALLLCVVSGVWLVVSSVFMPFLMSHINDLAVIFPRLVTLLNSSYLVYGHYSGRTVGRSDVLFAFVMMAIIAATEHLYPEEAKDREWRLIKYNQFFLLMVYGLDGAVPALYRIARLFSFAAMVYYPNLIRRIRKSEYRFIVYVLVIGYFALFFYLNFSGGKEGFRPYQTIFSEAYYAAQE